MVVLVVVVVEGTSGSVGLYVVVDCWVIVVVVVEVVVAVVIIMVVGLVAVVVVHTWFW